MPRATDDPTLTVPSARAEFRRANPEMFGKVQGDLETTQRLGVVELRAEAIKQRFQEHFYRHEDAWTAREALSLVAKRSFPTLQHPAPRGFETRRSQADVSELMMTKARQNVHARAIQRLTTINTIKASMQNALVRNRPRQAQGPADDPRQKNTIRQSNT